MSNYLHFRFSRIHRQFLYGLLKIHVNGKTSFTEFNTTVPLPYLVLYYLIPFLDNCRTTGRFFVIASLSFAVLMGYGASELLKSNRINKKAATIVITGLIVFEYLAVPVSLSPVDEPSFYKEISQDKNNYALLEIPATKDYVAGSTIIYYQTIHDPYVDHWYEMENQDTYPASGHSWKRFFRNQEGLTKLKIESDFSTAIKDIEALILAVPHNEYLNFEPETIVKMAGGPIAVIDCFGILSDKDIKKYFELGCEVKALGRGHENAVIGTNPVVLADYLKTQSQ